MFFSWSNLILGICGIALGIWVVKEAFYLNHHVLFLGWVEKKWGPGTGTAGYRYLGLILIIFSMLVAIGQIDLFGNPNSSTSSNRSQTTQVQNNRNNVGPSIAP